MGFSSTHFWHFVRSVPAALYSAFVGELVRGRTFRRRLETRRSTPSVVLNAMNRILNDKLPVDKAVDEMIARIKTVAAN